MRLTDCPRIDIFFIMSLKIADYGYYENKMLIDYVPLSLSDRYCRSAFDGSYRRKAVDPGERPRAVSQIRASNPDARRKETLHHRLCSAGYFTELPHPDAALAIRLTTLRGSISGITRAVAGVDG